MEILALVIILAAAFLVSLWVSQPFNRPPSISAKTPKKTKNQELEIEHQRILDALLELDFDHDQGKLDEENYQSQRQYLLQAGVETLKQMDED